MKKVMAVVAALSLVATMSSPVLAEGNLASRATELELNINTVDLAFSQAQFEIETGKYYILHVTSDGAEEIQVVAPELWRNSWINQVVVNDLETTPYGLYGIEFDGHPDLRRILLGDDWQGHPLLKSYAVDTPYPPYR